MNPEPLTEAHLTTFVEMVVQFYADDPGNYPMSRERALRQARQMLALPDRVRPLLLREYDRIIGYAILVPYYSNEYGGWTVWIDELFIHESDRGRGLAGRFLAWLNDWARQNAMTRIVLETRPVNERARRLYQRHGFSLNFNRMMDLQLENPEGPYEFARAAE